MKTRFTDKDGEVRELADADVKRMRSMSEVLPANLQRTISQRGKQRSRKRVIASE
jgi:hypothetical protein